MKTTLSKKGLAIASAAFAALGTTALCLGASDITRHGEKLKKVSLIDLIANSDKFDGQRLIVEGFVRLEFEGNALYLHEEDYRYSLCSNGVSLNLTQKERDLASGKDSKYCAVIGTYHAVHPGRFSLWSGSLSQVKFAFLLSPAGQYQPTPGDATPKKPAP